jgi:hypothetical protein
MKGMIRMLKLASLLDTINNCNDIKEGNRSVWMMGIVKQALEKRRKELIIEKIKNWR